MKHQKILSILICLILNISIGFSQKTWEYRSNYEIQYPISDALDFKLKPKIWFEGIIKKHYSSDIEIGFDKKFNNWLTFSPYYRHIILFKENSRSIEYRPQADIMFSYRFNEIFFQSRNRFEYRIKSNSNSIRYRNKLSIKIQVPDTYDIGLALAEEPFFDFTNKIINKNRFYLNFSIPLKTKITAEIFYILESFKVDKGWNKIDVIGTALKIKL